MTGRYSTQFTILPVLLTSLQHTVNKAGEEGKSHYEVDVFDIYWNMLYKQLMLKIRTPGYLFFGTIFGLGMAGDHPRCY